MKTRLLALLFIACCGPALAAFEMQDARSQADQCDRLFSLTDANHAIEPGVMVKAVGNRPAHCRVRGVIDGTIGFEVSMPLDDWQERMMFHAVGGTAGVIGDTTSLLSQGFAMASTDTGHQASNSQGSSFARDHAALVNFGFRAIHLTTVLAKRIIAEFYGREAQYAYIWGCSNGGRAALVEALRYPEDFDGVIAGAPASGWGREIVPWGVAAHRKQLEHPLTIESLEILDARSETACDLLDGLRDGIISDPLNCSLDVLKLEELECAQSQTSGCLTAGQIETARFIYTGVTDESGKVLSPGVLPGAESAGEWEIWVVGNPDFMPVTGHESMGGIIENLYHRVPGFSLDQFDPVKDRYALAEATVSVELPTPDFRRFRERSGKLLIYQGWQDMPCRARELLNYVGEAERLNGGPEGMAEFSRLFMVPGMLHCAAGPGAWAADYVQAIVNWVEEDRAPERITAHQPGIVNWLEAFAAMGAEPVNWVEPVLAAGAMKGDVPRFTRPLCPHPQYARYVGSGDIGDAENFVCSQE